MRPAACCLALLLAGCSASLPSIGPARTNSASATPLGEVAARRSTPGQCVLALWTRGAPTTRILIATDNPAVAHISVAGRDVVLERADAAGAAVFGHTPRQVWRGGGIRLALEAAFVAREGMVGGVVVEDAALTLTEANGAETIIPVGGLVACQA